MKQTETDVLIIGSGPVGATYARMISDALPGIKIMMIDLGPRLTDKAGMHIKNIEDERQRERAQIQSQGPHKKPYPTISFEERGLAGKMGQLSLEILGRPGTHLIAEKTEDLYKTDMPAASYSSNVGGMGVHWTGACPRPGNAERIPFIPDNEYEIAFSKAEELLHVTQSAFTESAEGLAILQTLGGIFNPQLSKDRQVQPMPLACVTNKKSERYWVGPDVIFGELAMPGDKENFELRTQTLCRQLYHQSDQVTGALLEHLPSGTKEEVTAKIIVVACDAHRTSQLLWASGIRPEALGHYLNEHPFIFCAVELKDELVRDLALQTSDGKGVFYSEETYSMETPKSEIANPKSYDPSARTEPTIGVFWVPFDAPGHPFHGQVMHMDVSPLKMETGPNPMHIVGLGWACRKEVRYENCIEFSETETDYLGMPKLNLKFSYTGWDTAQIEQAKKEQAKAAAAFGKQVKEGEQTLMPPGTSLHTSGTVRMGESNDGTSVCDSYSNVWDFDNLFVGGNGVIPTATTSNPTLTSVAMAVRGAEKIISLLANKKITTST